MAENRTTDAVKLNLRLPKSLHRQLVQQATRRNVSLNTEIVEQLQGSRARSYKDLQKTVSQALSDSPWAQEITKDLQKTVFQFVTKSMKDSPPPELFREWTREGITKEFEVLRELLTKTVRDNAPS